MATLALAMPDGLLVAPLHEPHVAEERLGGRALRCLVADPGRPGRLYCGTRGEGLWRSDDAGWSWHRVASTLDDADVTALEVGPRDGALWAGTEPSRIYRSDDGGESWHECPGLADLPSSGEWSFPPRPETHHVRWITADPHRSGRLWVAVEAGALVRSLDEGASWIDRVPGGPRDTHTLRTHPTEPGRLCAAAGDGWFESRDGGEGWERPREGLAHSYLWSVWVSPDEPGTAVVTAASGAHRAHDATQAHGVVYRREGGGPWRRMRAGLPDPEGTTVGVLAAGPASGPTLFLACNRGIWRSDDAGATWVGLDLPWPDRFGGHRPQGLVGVDSAP